ncbi:Tn3 family transposase [Streptomyces sp. NBC_00191]|uniref:Tn3 family transposase n=1 Tax=Streptomyces sp. NBC_00191 TaxID=2975674 RepID=UPI003862D864
MEIAQNALLLEAHGKTRMFNAFEHIGGKVSRPEDIDLTLTALLVSKSTNIGLESVIKPGERALTRGRLAGADHGYFHLSGIRSASGWGGGPVASADGMRFPGADALDPHPAQSKKVRFGPALNDYRHAVEPNPGGRRIAFASFLALTTTGQLIAWS